MANELILHSGGHEATIDEVRAVPTPAPLGRHCPIPHADLLDRVTSAVRSDGTEIVDAHHGLAKSGSRYFGVLTLSSTGGGGEYSTVVGVRNSHDKSFPAALCMGSRVFICDNLAFCGEVQVARKHTTNILRDLDSLVYRAVSSLGAIRHGQDVRIAAYKSMDMSDRDVHDFLVRSIDAGAIPAQSLPHILHEWREPQHEAFEPRNLWSLFNCYTEVAKGLSNPDLVRSRTIKLHGLADVVCGLSVAT